MMNMNACLFLQCSVHSSLTTNKHQTVVITLYHLYEIPPPQKNGHGAAAPLLDRDRRPHLTLEIHPKVMTILYRIQTYHHN